MKKNRVISVCSICGTGTEARASMAIRLKTCSRACASEYRRRLMIGNRHAAGLSPNHVGFKPGQMAWNRGMRGRHFSPATEFSPGSVPTNKMVVGTVRIRTSKRSGEQRAWVKIAEPNAWRLRAVVIWEARNGAIPAGRLVHHKDRDTLHDDILNLELQTRADHLNEHRPEFEERRNAAAISARKAKRRLQADSGPS